MTYQIGDLNNGVFGETYETLAEAEKQLAECIAEGKAINLKESGSECGTDGTTCESFFFIAEQEA